MSRRPLQQTQPPPSKKRPFFQVDDDDDDDAEDDDDDDGADRTPLDDRRYGRRKPVPTHQQPRSKHRQPIRLTDASSSSSSTYASASSSSEKLAPPKLAALKLAAPKLKGKTSETVPVPTVVVPPPRPQGPLAFYASMRRRAAAAAAAAAKAGHSSGQALAASSSSAASVASAAQPAIASAPVARSFGPAVAAPPPSVGMASVSGAGVGFVAPFDLSPRTGIGDPLLAAAPVQTSAVSATVGAATPRVKVVPKTLLSVGASVRRGGEGTAPWSVRHAPRELEELAGQANAVRQLNLWIETFRREEYDVPRAALLVGPSGTGKTTAVQLIKQRYGYSLTEFEAAFQMRDLRMHSKHRNAQNPNEKPLDMVMVRMVAGSHRSGAYLGRCRTAWAWRSIAVRSADSCRRRC